MGITSEVIKRSLEFIEQQNGVVIRTRFFRKRGLSTYTQRS
jgi:hypothetical protein